jgi:hypothetical protein
VLAKALAPQHDRVGYSTGASVSPLDPQGQFVGDIFKGVPALMAMLSLTYGKYYDTAVR